MPVPRIKGSYQSNKGARRKRNDHGAPQSGCSLNGKDCKCVCCKAIIKPKMAGTEMASAATVRAQNRCAGSIKHSIATNQMPNNAIRCSIHITQGFIPNTYCANNEALTPPKPINANKGTVILGESFILIIPNHKEYKYSAIKGSLHSNLVQVQAACPIQSITLPTVFPIRPILCSS